MVSIKQQKKKAYLASEQYTAQLLGIKDNESNQAIIKLKQIQLTWNRKLKTLKD